jgi:hypothetical protein
MNDMAHPPATFQVIFETEQIETAMFGTVSVSEIPSRRLTKLYQEHDPEHDGQGFGNALLCECITGEHGERFTFEVLESLPNRALPDMKAMMSAAIRLNGMNREEVEKASPLL